MAGVNIQVVSGDSTMILHFIKHMTTTWAQEHFDSIANNCILM